MRRSIFMPFAWALLTLLLGPASLQAQLPNLAFYPHTNWDFVSLPTTSIHTSQEIRLPAILPGDVSTTYWNTLFKNNGTATLTGFFLVANSIDGVLFGEATFGPNIPIGQGAMVLDYGPEPVASGRHTWSTELDLGNAIAESDETDNIFGHQFVWEPPVVTPNAAMLLPSPPDPTGGWETITDGSTIDYNCRGLRVNSSGWWNMVTMSTSDENDDYDLYLYNPSLNSLQGFQWDLAYSLQGPGKTDALIINSNQLAPQDWDIGVRNYSGGSSSPTMEHVTSLPLYSGEELNGNLGEYSVAAIYDTYIDPADVGLVTIRVETPDTSYPLHVGLLDKNFTYGSLAECQHQATTDAKGHVHVTIDFASSGYYGVVVWRDGQPGLSWLPAQGYSISVAPALPDLVPQAPEFWADPLVPRPLPDGLPNLVAAPDTLIGNAESTYFNLAIKNASAVTSPVTEVTTYLDDQELSTYLMGAWTSYYSLTVNDITGFAIPGGRHTIAVAADPLVHVAEDNESNNLWTKQYCWAPFEIPADVTLFSPAAPANPPFLWDPTPPDTPWYTPCDGVRVDVNDPTAWWVGAALASDPGTDHDLKMFEALSGVNDGFKVSLAYSNFVSGETDYVLVNRNMTSWRPMDFGVINYSGSGSYSVNRVISTPFSGVPGGVYGPFTLDTNELVDFLDLYLEVGTYNIRLENLAGTVDWGLGLHPADAPYVSRDMVVPGGSAYAAGPGQDEYLYNLDITTDGWYGLAAFKHLCADQPLAGEYRLYITQGVSGVDEGPTDLPAATTVTGVYPNPFNPRTTIAFELETAATARLAIYDLKGVLVRRLVDGFIPAGRHEAVWDGTDQQGNHSASGTYLARLETGATVVSRKMVLLK